VPKNAAAGGLRKAVLAGVVRQKITLLAERAEPISRLSRRPFGSARLTIRLSEMMMKLFSDFPDM
jgi:hypothetical protein